MQPVLSVPLDPPWHPCVTLQISVSVSQLIEQYIQPHSGYCYPPSSPICACSGTHWWLDGNYGFSTEGNKLTASDSSPSTDTVSNSHILELLGDCSDRPAAEPCLIQLSFDLTASSTGYLLNTRGFPQHLSVKAAA